MAAISTSWLIGSITIPNTTIVVNASNVVIPAGTYYLRDADTGLSLVDQIAIAISTVVAATTCYIGADRRLRIVSGGGALTLTIGTAILEATGLATNPTVGTTITATLISTLLWSPSWPGRPASSPVGLAGHRVYDRVVSASPSGQTVTVNWHNYQTIVALSWSAVPAARTWTSAELGGEFVSFYYNVLIPGYRWKHYAVSEDSTVTTSVSWPTALGPYKAHTIAPDWYRRFVEASDAHGANIELEAVVTSELT